MSTSDTGHEITRAELPPLVDRYVVAHDAKDTDTAIATFTPDATVTDEGRARTGTAEIREWLDTSSTEWTYTTTPVAFRRIDDRNYLVVQHLEGDFPGGVVDLNYRFGLRDGLIAELVIEP